MYKLLNPESVPDDSVSSAQLERTKIGLFGNDDRCSVGTELRGALDRRSKCCFTMVLPSADLRKRREVRLRGGMHSTGEGHLMSDPSFAPPVIPENARILSCDYEAWAEPAVRR